MQSYDNNFPMGEGTTSSGVSASHLAHGIHLKGKDTMTPTMEQIKAIRAICDAITDAVKAAGDNGAPGGIIYAALMGYGCSFNQYQQFMAGLVRAGKIRQEGNLYYAI